MDSRLNKRNKKYNKLTWKTISGLVSTPIKSFSNRHVILFVLGLHQKPNLQTHNYIFITTLKNKNWTKMIQI